MKNQGGNRNRKSEIGNQKSEVRNQKSEVRSQKSEGRIPEVGNQTPDIRARSGETRNQKSKVGNQEPKVRSANHTSGTKKLEISESGPECSEPTGRANRRDDRSEPMRIRYRGTDGSRTRIRTARRRRGTKAQTRTSGGYVLFRTRPGSIREHGPRCVSRVRLAFVPRSSRTRPGLRHRRHVRSRHSPSRIRRPALTTPTPCSDGRVLRSDFSLPLRGEVSACCLLISDF